MNRDIMRPKPPVFLDDNQVWVDTLAEPAIEKAAFVQYLG